jgi:GDP/UDP-N,N'-diacetylbacillosamine 2-epimerase (hydrolysing)
MKNKICVVTGSRADYGLLYPLLKEIEGSNKFCLQLVVAGAHLSPQFGSTYKEIIKDGFKITARVPMLAAGDSEVAITRSVSSGLLKFADTFKSLKPKFVLLLGDRFEVLAAAIAAFLQRIPIVHLHGGELTEGLIDDAIRHNVTKMSFLHFVSMEAYRRRVIQLGESPDRVFTVGALGLDNIRTMPFSSRAELEKRLKMSFGSKSVMVTFHPVTLNDKKMVIKDFKEILEALNNFKDLTVIFTRPNADMNNRPITEMINAYVHEHPKSSYCFTSMGRTDYLSVLKIVDAVAGNSSSGIIEFPSFGKPTVDIGDRQRGRVKAKTVISCQSDSQEITRALKKALSDGFRQECRKFKNPYGDGHAAKRILKILTKYSDKTVDIKKRFYDLG